MNIWPIVGLFLTAIGVGLAIVTTLTGSIDKKIEQKLQDPAFVKQIASQLRAPFIVFDEDERVIYNSDAEPFLETPKIIKNKGEVDAVVITGKKFLTSPPMLIALDGKIQFKDPIRVNSAGWRFEAFDPEYVGASREEGRLPYKFKVEILTGQN